MVPPGAVEAFKKKMTDAKVDYTVIMYPGAKHAFTNPDADSHKMDALKYDKKADEDSFEKATKFLSETLGK